MGSAPPYSHLVLFCAAYVLAGGLGQGLAIVPGVAITFWPPAGIFVATLLRKPPSEWAWFVGAGCLAELTCNAVWFHNPVGFALVYFVANTLEALTAAWLVRKVVRQTFQLASLEEVAALVVLGAGAAPIVGATVIATTDALRGRHAFGTAWPLVWLGDATGLLVSAPLTVVLLQVWSQRGRLKAWRVFEAVATFALIVFATALAIGGSLPTMYAALPPVLWAAARFRLKGAAIGLSLVTLVTAVMTASGQGQIVEGANVLQSHVVLLQAFLGISAVSALIVASVSTQRQQALDRVAAANLDLEARVEERTAALRESENRLAYSLRAAMAGSWHWDVPTGRLSWSEENYRLLDIGPVGRDLDYSDWTSRVHPDDLPRMQAAVDDLVEGRSDELHGEYRVVRSDGTFRWLLGLGKIERSEDGGPLQVSGLNLDITDRKLAEMALKEADLRKDEFLATLAHELRNPLAPIRSGLDLLEMTRDPAITDEARRVMGRQLGHLVRLVDDLLDIARLQTGNITLRVKRVDLRTVVQSAVEAVRPLVESRSHTVVVHVPGVAVDVEGDETRLVQIVANLLNNAAKYTDPGGTLEVSVFVADDRAEIVVTDNGIGIRPDQLETLWDMYAQVRSSRDRAEGGLGIGLSLVRRLVGMHGGSVSAQSEGPGKGSAFTIRLPLSVSLPVLEPDILTGVDASPTGPAMERILIIEDNADVAQMLCALLRHSGRTAEIAPDGRTAFAIGQKFRPDAVLCDIGLPDMDGFEVARRIREQDGLRDVRLIALTGWGSEDDKRRAVDAGFDGHLTKPVDLDMLERVLGRSTSQTAQDGPSVF